MPRRRVAGCVLLGLALAAPAPAAGSPQTPRVESLTRVSGATPFPGPCGTESPTFVAGESEEATVAVDPADPRTVVVAWIQDGGRTNLVAAPHDAICWRPRRLRG